MNMRLLILGLGAGGLIGYAGGWALRGATKESSAATATVSAAENAAATKTNRKNGRVPNPTVEAELRKLAEHPNQQFGSDYERWELADLKALVATMLAQADPVTGLSGQHKGVLNWIVRAMARKDMEGTLAWIDATFPKQRYEYYKEAIQLVMSKASAIEQLEFLKGRSFEPSDHSRFAGELLFRNKVDTENGLFLLKHLNGDDGDYVSNVTFAAGFDFSRFGAATIEKAKANGNQAPAIFPMNFLQEWARVSPQAALDFYYAHCTGKDAIKLYNNDLHGILKGVKSTLRPEDYSPWLGQLLQQQSGATGANANSAQTILEQELRDPAILGAALNSIQDSAVREKLQRETLALAAEASMNVDNLGKLRDALSLYQDPAARLASAEDLVHKLKQRNGDQEIPRMIELLTQQLTNLGHSEAEVQKVRDAK